MKSTTIKVNGKQYKITAKTSSAMGLISRTIDFNHFTTKRLLEIANSRPGDFEVTTNS